MGLWPHFFKRGPRPRPIAPFKTRPKVVVLGHVLNVAIAFTLGHVLNVAIGPGLGPHLKSAAIGPLLTTIGESYSRV